jgi:ankyrin repeat protein
MPFSTDVLYVRATPQARQELDGDPVLSPQLHWMAAASVERSTLPPEGLLAVRNIVPPEHIHSARSVPWDALIGPQSLSPRLPDPRTISGLAPHDWPPAAMLRRLADLARRCRTPVCYYRMETFGGTVNREVAWVFGDQHHLLFFHSTHKSTIAFTDAGRASPGGDVLQRALTLIGVEESSGWFEPHTSGYDWESRRHTALDHGAPLPPVPRSLYRSVQLADAAAVRRCLARGSDPEAYQRGALLHQAAAKGDTDIVRSLLKAGARVRTRYLNPLCNAATAEIAAALVEAGAAIDSEPDPLVEVAASGYDETARWLVAQGAQVPAPTDTPKAAPDLWFAACKGGLLWLMQRLCGQGIDLKAKRPGRWGNHSGLTLAAAGGHRHAVRWLIEQGASLDAAALVNAAEHGHIAIVRSLLDQGVPLMATENRCTAIHKAASAGHLEMVCLLLDQGADPQVRTWSNETPLHAAAQGGHLQVIARLLEAGVPTDIAADHGRTPLWCAVGRGRQEAVDLLLAHSANPDLCNRTTSVRDFAKRRKIVIP